MSLGHWLGSTKISSETIFDSHLALIFCAVLIALWILFVGRKFITALRPETKVLVVRLSGVAILMMMSLFMLQFVIRNFSNNENVSKFFVINNVDMLTALLFSLSVLSNRHKLARVLLPLLLVFGGMRLINNPNVELDSLENFSILLSMGLAILVFVIVERNLTVREMLIGQFVTMAIIAYSFIFNTMAGTRFSTIAISDIYKNPVYNWIGSDVARIILFFGITATFEFIVWAVIRISTINAKKHNLLLAAKTLFKIDEKSVQEFAKGAYDYLVKREIFEAEEFKGTPSEITKQDEEEIVLSDAPEYYLDFTLPSFAVVKAKINAIRAPSL